MKSFSGMFNEDSTWLSYPFNDTSGKELSNTQNYTNFINNADGKLNDNQIHEIGFTEYGQG